MSDINTALGIESDAHTQNVNTQPGWFDGRASRREYWSKCIWAFSLVMFVGLPLILIPICSTASRGDCSFARSEILSTVLGILVIIFSGLAIWPVTVRRLHDRGMSGWWILWFALLGGIPFVGEIAGIVQFVIVGCMDGIPGPNKYGPNPKDRCCAGGSGIENNHAMPSPSSEERLQKLTELKDKRMISETEYEQKRSQILSEL